MMDELNDLKQASKARDDTRQRKAAMTAQEKQTAAELKAWIAEQKAKLKWQKKVAKLNDHS